MPYTALRRISVGSFSNCNLAERSFSPPGNLHKYIPGSIAINEKGLRDVNDFEGCCCSPCVMSVQLLLPFLACEDYMLCIFDNHDIANVEMRGELYLVLSLQLPGISC